MKFFSAFHIHNHLLHLIFYDDVNSSIKKTKIKPAVKLSQFLCWFNDKLASVISKYIFFFLIENRIVEKDVKFHSDYLSRQKIKQTQSHISIKKILI